MFATFEAYWPIDSFISSNGQDTSKMILAKMLQAWQSSLEFIQGVMSKKEKKEGWK